MIRKTISYTDYNDEEVIEDFYFNFTKLEVIEMMELEDLEGKLKFLTQTENAQEAYAIFKNIILRAYGEKSPDGKRFEKSDADGRPLSRRFEQSPACSEIILEFLQDPASGAKFIEGMLPAKMVAEAKMVQAAKGETVESNVEVPTAPPVLAPSKKFEDCSHEELLAMTNEEFQSLVPRDPKKMTKAQLMVAFERRAAS